nr:HigA family addiction module antitoxin [Pseudonocardia sp. C8]
MEALAEYGRSGERVPVAGLKRRTEERAGNEMKQSDAVTPGEILDLEFLTPMGLTPELLAERAGMSPSRVRHIIDGTHVITAGDANRLSAALGTSDRFWLNLQEAAEDR